MRGEAAVAPDHGGLERSARLTGCHHCGAVQGVPPVPRRTLLSCAVCDSALERIHGRSVTAALAFSSAALILLIAAILEPFLGTSIYGITRRSWVSSSATIMVRNGYPELCVAVGLCIIVFPLLRLALVTTVLGLLEAGSRPRWLGRAFRWAEALQPWAMLDVFLLGFVVAVARLRSELNVDLFLGAYCFGASALLSLMVRATLDSAAVWHRIGPRRPPLDGAPSIACNACKLVVPDSMEACPCPRCGARIHARKPNAVGRAAALILAAALLYLPANLYPMATLPIGLTPTDYTVLVGAIDLIDAKLYALGLLVLVASFVIPLGKLAGLVWCIASVLRRSDRRLVAKTRVFRVIEEIGRWSMIDVFVIASFVPITNFNALIYGRTGPAASAFAAVVILTTLAAQCFDPRLMWDAAQPRKPP